jgi:hypothetical protein
MEKIWAKRWVNDKVLFQVQWVGYHGLTWEPAHHTMNQPTSADTADTQLIGRKYTHR